jgi:hypothetical protein
MGSAALTPRVDPARLGRLLNTIIGIVLVADVIALITVEINHASRPKVTNTSAAPAKGPASAVALDQALSNSGAQSSPGQNLPTSDRAQTIGSAVLRLLAFEPSAFGTSATVTTMAGTTLAAANIQACSQAASASTGLRVDPALFRLELPDGTRIGPTQPAKTPPLPSTTVAQGRCATGWVTFPVAQNKRPSVLVYGGPQEVRWRL